MDALSVTKLIQRQARSRLGRIPLGPISLGPIPLGPIPLGPIPLGPIPPASAGKRAHTRGQVHCLYCRPRPGRRHCDHSDQQPPLASSCNRRHAPCTQMHCGRQYATRYATQRSATQRNATSRPAERNASTQACAADGVQGRLSSTLEEGATRLLKCPSLQPPHAATGRGTRRGTRRYFGGVLRGERSFD